MGHLLGNSTSNAAILDQIGRMQLDLEKTKDNMSTNLRSYQVGDLPNIFAITHFNDASYETGFGEGAVRGGKEEFAICR